MIKKIKRIVPAVVMSLSLISCQMGLANSNTADSFNARSAKVNGLADDSFAADGIDISYDVDNVYLRIDEPVGDAAIYSLYIDVDGDSSTGQNPGWWTGNGADFLIQKVNDCAVILHSYDETRDAWLDTQKDFYCEYDSEKHVRNLEISFDALGISPADIDKVGFAYMSMSGWNMPDDMFTAAPALWGGFAKYSPREAVLSDNKMKLTYDYKYINLSIDEPVSDAAIYSIYIDTDISSTAGQNPGWWVGNGTDFLVQKVNDWALALHKYDEKHADWVDTQKKVSCEYDSENHVRNLKIAFDLLGIKPADINKVGFAYMSMSGWNMPDDMLTIIPEQNTSFVSANPNNIGITESTFPRNRTDIGKGIIIPAYISLNEDITDKNTSGAWKNFISEIENIDISNKDFYVVVNGQNGPSGIQWDKARKIFKAIKAANGNIRIIAYVHTCKTTVPVNGNDFLEYRNIEGDDSVMGDIADWVDNSDNLIDGIWLDEFYPWYEIGSDGPSAGPTYPNGIENAPIDTTKFDNNGEWIWYNVDYTGGYYYKLCKKINDSYQDLLIIGNAGGGFRNTQVNYGELVDILVAFEQTYEYANEKCTYDGHTDETWMEYCAALGEKAEKKLALIHGAYSFDEIDSVEFRKQFLTEMKSVHNLKKLSEDYAEEVNQLYDGESIKESILSVSSNDFRKAVTKIFAEDFPAAVRKESEIKGKTKECFSDLLEAALKTAEANGFSHVYVTDREYGKDGNGNIWGGLPGYLKLEVEKL